MINIPEKHLRNVMVAVNVYFVVMGVISLGTGVFQLAVGQGRQQVAGVEENIKSDGRAAIVSGSLDIMIGTFGLIAFLMKKRLLLIIYASLMSLAIVTNIVAMILFSVAVHQTKKDSTEAVRENMRNHYGNFDEDEGIDFTMNINIHQRLDGCCGWSNNDDENIYKQTPWYSAKNKNVKGAHYTLPESCCIVVAAECYKAESIKEARKNKFVYNMDCMRKMNGRAKILLGLLLFKSIFAAVLQIIATAATIFHLVQTTT